MKPNTEPKTIIKGSYYPTPLEKTPTAISERIDFILTDQSIKYTGQNKEVPEYHAKQIIKHIRQAIINYRSNVVGRVVVVSKIIE